MSLPKIDTALNQDHPELEAAPLSSPPSPKNLLFKTLLVVGLLSLIAYGTYQFVPKPEEVASEPRATPSPQPTGKPIPTGKQIYRISRGKTAKGPNLKVVTLDPLDPKPGQTQIITATIENAIPLTLTNLNLQTDHQTTAYTLHRISGSDTKGVWQTEITFNDSYDHVYYVQFDLHDSNSTFDGGLRIR